MITLEELKSLDVGDVIEYFPLFPGVSPEPLLLAVTTPAASEPVMVLFEASYFGIKCGVVRAQHAGGEIVWERTP